MRPPFFIKTSSLLRCHQRPTRRSMALVSSRNQGDSGTGGGRTVVTATAAAALILCANTSRSPQPKDDASLSKNGMGLDSWKIGSVLHSTACSNESDYYEIDFDFDSEEERFRKARRFHRAQLDRYRKRWEPPEDEMEGTPASWPRRLPLPQEISALEFDFRFCQNHPDTNDQRYCDNLQFRIASYYLCRNYPAKEGDWKTTCCHDPATFAPRRGYYLLKDLADRGHADGMCLYGKILQQGRAWDPDTEGGEVGGLNGIEANPNDAVVWWRRAVDLHRQHHLPTLYELGVALYTGEGVPEDTQRAIRYFRKAAEQGHAGAAYMLADGLLHGVGVSQDRAEALDWLVNAAEQGHREAQRRVFAVLESTSSLHKRDKEDEEELGKWDLSVPSGKSSRVPVSIERRFTIGGGSRNPAVLARRKTVVDESRKG